MGNEKSDDEYRLRGRDLGGAERKGAVDHLSHEQKRNPDTELRNDDEKDSLYDDGLEIESDDSRPLTGVNGDDDSVRRG